MYPIIILAASVLPAPLSPLIREIETGGKGNSERSLAIRPDIHNTIHRAIVTNTTHGHSPITIMVMDRKHGQHASYTYTRTHKHKHEHEHEQMRAGRT